MKQTNNQQTALAVLGAILALLAVLALTGVDVGSVTHEINRLGTSIGADAAATAAPATPTPTAAQTQAAPPATEWSPTAEGTGTPYSTTPTPSVCSATVGQGPDGPSGDGYDLLYYGRVGDTGALGTIGNGLTVIINLFQQHEGQEWMRVVGYGWAIEGPRLPALSYPECWAVPAVLNTPLPPLPTVGPTEVWTPEPTTPPTIYYVGSKHTSPVNLRSAPGTWASIAGRLKHCSEDRAEVLEEVDDWFKVRVESSGLVAYVASWVTASCNNPY